MNFVQLFERLNLSHQINKYDQLQVENCSLGGTKKEILNLTLLNRRLLPYKLISDLIADLQHQGIKKINFFYENWKLHVADFVVLKEYLNHFFRKNDLNYQSYDLLFANEKQLILISEQKQQIESHLEPLFIYLETQFGLCLPKICIKTSHQIKKNSVKHQSLQKPAYHRLAQDFKSDSQSSIPSMNSTVEKLHLSKPQINLNKMKKIQIPLSKNNSLSAIWQETKNRKKIQGKILSVDSWTINNQLKMEILVDAETTAYILTLETAFNQIRNLTELKPQKEFIFECVERTIQRKNHLFIVTFQEKNREFQRQDHSPRKRIELQVHTKMSALDGITNAEDYLIWATHWGHSAIAFTDYENIHIFPELNRLSSLYPQTKIIYGCELNLLNDEYYVLSRMPKKSLKQQKFLFIDIETSGLSPVYDEIIEFAGILVQNNLVQEKMSFLIQSNHQITQNITDLTGITQSEYEKNAIPVSRAAQKIRTLLKDTVIVAHNAQFDFEFLNTFFQRFEKKALTNPVIDTLFLAYTQLPELKFYRLGRVARRLKVFYERDRAHRPMYDADIVRQIFPQLLKIKGLKKFAEIYALNQNSIIKSKIRSRRVTALVKNEQGLRNLYQLISISHTKKLYYAPSIEKEDLQNYHEGLYFGSGNQDSEIFYAAVYESPSALRKKIQKYDFITVSPPDVFLNLIERKIISQTHIKLIIENIIRIAREEKKILVASNDVYFLHANDKFYRDIFIFNKQLKGKPHRFYDRKHQISGSPPQYLRTTEEMKKAFAFLKNDTLVEEIVVDNPHQLAKKIETFSILSNQVCMPKLLHAPKKLTQLAKESFQAKYSTHPNEKLKERFNHELKQIIDQGYATIYLIAYHLNRYSAENDYLVGSRGSVGSSFLAYCLGITEVNPLNPHYSCSQCGFFQWESNLKYRSGFDLPERNCSHCHVKLARDGHIIPFESFLGLNAQNIPDIDLNFSGEFQEKAQIYVTQWLEKEFGKNKIFRAGTVSTVAKRTAYEYYKNYCELFPERKDNFAEIQKIVHNLIGVKRTTGQHPGGLMIVPKEKQIFEFTPYNYPSNNPEEKYFTTHFDYHALNNSLLKIDILGHDDPTGLRMLAKMTNHDPKKIPIAEPAVIKLFTDGNILGFQKMSARSKINGALALPEFGTGFVRRLLQDAKPQTFADLISISGLSHGQNVWESNARDLVLEKKNNIRLPDVIACRDDIMTFLQARGIPLEKAYHCMQVIKKGRGLDEKTHAYLQKKQIPNWFIDSCQKIRYLFPKAHATAYVIMAYRFAWYKIHYPAEFYATYFTIRCSFFDLSTIIGGSAIISAKQKFINQKRQKEEISAKEKGLLSIFEVALEMWNRNIEMKPLHLNFSTANQFIVRNEKNKKVIYPPFNAVDGLGTEAAKNIIFEREKASFQSHEDFQERTKVNRTVFENLVNLGVLKNLPVSQQKKFTF